MNHGYNQVETLCHGKKNELSKELEEAATFDSLPDDVVIHIFSFLPLKDRIIVSRVVSWFIPLLDQLWSRQSCISFQYSDKPVFDSLSSLLVRELDKKTFNKVATRILSKCSQLQRVYFSNQFDGSILAESVNPEHLVEIACQDLHIIRDFVNCTTGLYEKECNLVTITFVRGYKTNMFTLPPLDFLEKCTKLKELSIDLPPNDDSFKHLIPSSVIDNLKQFTVNRINQKFC